jgi:hypothetical protein
MNAASEVPDAPPKSAAGFWSIERFVAFLLGPAIAAGAGWFSTFLAREIGIKVNKESIVVIFGAATLAAGGLAYKWLHGRQVEMQVSAELAKVEAIPGVGGLVHTTVHDLEGLAESAASKVVGQHMPAPVPAASSPSADLPPPVSVPPAAHDPAPAGEPVADEGAATEE